MAGNNSSTKSIHKQNKNKSSSAPSFSFSNLFKPKRSTPSLSPPPPPQPLTVPKKAPQKVVDDIRDGPVTPRKVWRSDYYKGRYMAEPGIDRKASDFIAKFHESRNFVDSEVHKQPIAV